jgi:AbrB family looped-hinge helix DNA binding protein
MAVRVTRKGQITIPREIRQRLGLEPGDEVEFVQDDHGVRVQKRRDTSPFGEYQGYLTELAGRDPDEVVESMRGR